MLLTELRELIRLVLEDVDPKATYELTSDDLFEYVFAENTDRPRPGKVYVAYPVLPNFNRQAALGPLAVKGAVPRDAVDAIKYGSSKRAGLEIVLTVKPQARQAFVERAATRIAAAHANLNVDLLVAVESSKPLARELTEIVASKLNVPVVTLEKATTMADVEPDQEMLDRFDKWVDNTSKKSWADVEKARALGKKTTTTASSYDEYIDNMLQHLIDDRNHMASNAAKERATSIAASLPPGRRQYHNLFKKIDTGTSQRALLVDDNVAGGNTMTHAVERLIKSGMDPKNVLMAAATDYPSPSRK